MLSLLQSLSGVVVVVDSFAAPSLPLVRLVLSCPVALSGGSLLLSADAPLHRIPSAPSSVVNLYDADVSVFPAVPNSAVAVVVLHGLTRLLERLGPLEVLRGLAALRSAHAAVVATVHAECLVPEALPLLEDFATTLIRLGPAGVVDIRSRRKGGRVFRSRERVTDWCVPTVAPAAAVGPVATAAPETRLEAAGAMQRQVALPFVKTAVAGKMMFDVEDMRGSDDRRAGDYESDASDDPDDDLDI